MNIWTPAASAANRLPVLVYSHGGGFQSEDGSEPRHDGAALARRGIVTVTVNYHRLGLYGFLAHPWLSAESAHGGSGNYGLLDQSVALRWVQQNISAFGGDPRRVTIAGNSSGAASVSALMVSPRSRDLFAGAIGSAGALITPAWTESAGAFIHPTWTPWVINHPAEVARFIHRRRVPLRAPRTLEVIDLGKLAYDYGFFPGPGWGLPDQATGRVPRARRAGQSTSIGGMDLERDRPICDPPTRAANRGKFCCGHPTPLRPEER